MWIRGQNSNQMLAAREATCATGVVQIHRVTAGSASERRQPPKATGAPDTDSRH